MDGAYYDGKDRNENDNDRMSCSNRASGYGSHNS
jgi:hypothetical protein